MRLGAYRYLPLNLYLAYSIFVLGGISIGPVQYRDLDLVLLVSYVVAVVTLFAVGYLHGAKGGCPPEAADFGRRTTLLHRHKSFFRILLSLSVISALNQWFLFFSAGGALALGEIGQSYLDGYEGYQRGQANVDFKYVLNIFDQAFINLALVVGFYYFKVLNVRRRYAFLFVAATYLIVNVIGTGKQKYLGDMVVFWFYAVAVNLAARRAPIRWSVVLRGGFAVCLGFVLFVEILRQRYSVAGIDLANIYIKAHPLISWDENSFVLSLVGVDYALALGIFLSYFTNGLYGLYLSLTLPFEWTYFVGNSYSLGRIVELLFGTPGAVLEHTYPYRVGEAYGWGLNKWHSLFAWLASDITFAGVLLLAPVFGYVYARVWLRAVRADNLFAGPLFLYLSLALAFSFANNQLMHGLAGVLVLLTLVIGGGYLDSRAARMRVHRAQLPPTAKIHAG